MIPHFASEETETHGRGWWRQGLECSCWLQNPHYFVFLAFYFELTADLEKRWKNNTKFLSTLHSEPPVEHLYAFFFFSERCRVSCRHNAPFIAKYLCIFPKNRLSNITTYDYQTQENNVVTVLLCNLQTSSTSYQLSHQCPSEEKKTVFRGPGPSVRSHVAPVVISLWSQLIRSDSSVLCLQWPWYSEECRPVICRISFHWGLFLPSYWVESLITMIFVKWRFF